MSVVKKYGNNVRRTSIKFKTHQISQNSSNFIIFDLYYMLFELSMPYFLYYCTYTTRQAYKVNHNPLHSIDGSKNNSESNDQTPAAVRLSCGFFKEGRKIIQRKSEIKKAVRKAKSAYVRVFCLLVWLPAFFTEQLTR